MGTFTNEGPIRAVDPIKNVLDNLVGEAAVDRIIGALENSPIVIISESAFFVHRNAVDLDDTTLAGTLNCGQYNPIDWTTEDFDNNSDFDLALDRFRAPIDGSYSFEARVAVKFVDNVAAPIANSADAFINLSYSVANTFPKNQLKFGTDANGIIELSLPLTIFMLALQDVKIFLSACFGSTAPPAGSKTILLGDKTKTFFAGQFAAPVVV